MLYSVWWLLGVAVNWCGGDLARWLFGEVVIWCGCYLEWLLFGAVVIWRGGYLVHVYFVWLLFCVVVIWWVVIWCGDYLMWWLFSLDSITFITSKCKGTLFKLIRMCVDAGPIIQQDGSHAHMASTSSLH